MKLKGIRICILMQSFSIIAPLEMCSCNRKQESAKGEVIREKETRHYWSWRELAHRLPAERKGAAQVKAEFVSSERNHSPPSMATEDDLIELKVTESTSSAIHVGDRINLQIDEYQGVEPLSGFKIWIFEVSETGKPVDLDFK